MSAKHNILQRDVTLFNIYRLLSKSTYHKNPLLNALFIKFLYKSTPNNIWY